MGCNKLPFVLPMLLAIYTMLGNTMVVQAHLRVPAVTIMDKEGRKIRNERNKNKITELIIK